MKHSFIFAILFCACGFSLHAQNKKVTTSTAKPASKYSKTASGLEYRIIKDSISKPIPEKGGYVTFWFQLRNSKDSILQDQFKSPNPVGIPTPELTHKAGIEEGLLLLTEGDSALFLLNADSLYLNSFQQPRPATIAAGSLLKMIIKMGKVYSKSFVDSVMAVQEKQMQSQNASSSEVYIKDSIAIQEYLTKNKLKGQRTSDGTYVVILKPSTTGKTFIAAGEEIETTYIGTLLIGGSEFDRSPAGEYFKFPVGQGQVIKGWDQGFQKLKHGDKALILIPSRSAYGTRGAGGAIPPNAPLVFEVEVK